MQTHYPMFAFNVKQTITREDGIPYLIRRTLIRIGKYFSIKIHKIVMSDDACLHDHPWAFLSVILKGGYYEWSYYNPDKDKNIPGIDLGYAGDGRVIKRVWYKPGSILFRKANYAHSLQLMEDPSKWVRLFDGDKLIREEMYAAPCKTLVFTFKVVRKWGFLTKTGWMYYRNYSKKEHC